jgi:hypothetical protein
VSDIAEIYEAVSVWISRKPFRHPDDCMHYSPESAEKKALLEQGLIERLQGPAPTWYVGGELYRPTELGREVLAYAAALRALDSAAP